MKYLTFRHALITAALVGGTTVALWAQVPNPPPYPQSAIPLTPGGTPGPSPQRSSQMTQPADPRTARQVRTALSGVIDTAVTEDQFPELIAQLAQRHRTRIGPMPREDYGLLNRTLSQFRQEFQNRFHQPFAFTADMLKSADITVGPTGKVALVTLAVPDRRQGPGPSGLAPPSGPNSGMADPVYRGEPFVVNGPLVALTNEGSDRDALWKLDIPDTITGRQLKENLTHHIQHLTDDKATWAADAGHAYQATAREVLLALWDKSPVVKE